jgi:CRISPR/Cas system-associated protein Cas7 (RAMP superfamily)
MFLKAIGLEGMDWIAPTQDRDRWRALVKAVMNLRGSIKCGEFLG